MNCPITLTIATIVLIAASAYMWWDALSPDGSTGGSSK